MRGLMYKFKSLLIIFFVFFTSLSYADFYIVVDENLKELDNKECFQTWIKQLKSEGHEAKVIFSENNFLIKNESQFRQMLQDENIEGAIFVGQFEIPKKKIFFYENDDRNTKFHTVQTILHLMAPQVPISKISELVSGEYNSFDNFKKQIGFINLPHGDNKIINYCSYFSRNIAYRTCPTSTSKPRVLWFNAPDSSQAPHISVINDEFTEIKNLLELYNDNPNSVEKYDFAEIAAHSNPRAHGIHYNIINDPNFSGKEYDRVSVVNVKNFNTPIKFYTLVACSTAKSSFWGANIAETYFSQKDTLGVIAMTKIASILKRDQLYGNLAKGYSFGETLVSYFNYVVAMDIRATWFVGLVYYGDPTLTLKSCGMPNL